jgi:choline dehydrogenase
VLEKNLQDHVNIPITYHSKENLGLSGKTSVEIEDAVAEWQKDRTGIITSNWAALGGHVKSSPEVEDPDLQLYFIPATGQDLARYNTGGAGFNFYATLQRPKSSGEITLRSADPLEYPAIDPKYFMNDENNTDINTMIEGVKINREIAAQSPIAELIKSEVAPSSLAKTDQEIGDVIRSHCTTLYHPAGTCKMGTDDMAVVDPELKLNGVDNVRIADASIMPHMISGNLQATVIMTAERCSKFMRNH